MEKGMKLNVQGEEAWMDFELWKKQEEFMKEQERKYWDWIANGGTIGQIMRERRLNTSSVTKI